MGNPAELLLQQFKAWSAPSATPKSSRGLHGAQRERALAEHVEAMARIKVLTQVVDVLEQNGRRTARYRRAIPLWIHAVLAYPVGWAASNSNPQLFPDIAMDTLEGLADDIDHYVPAVVATPDSEAWRILEQIGDLLKEEPDLDDRLRLYIHRLLQHVRDCLEDYQSQGAFDLRDALMRLWVALKAAEGEASEANKSRFRRFAEDVWPATFAGFLSSVPQVALAVAQLTQSGS